jgi:hypothetical protein
MTSWYAEPSSARTAVHPPAPRASSTRSAESGTRVSCFLHNTRRSRPQWSKSESPDRIRKPPNDIDTGPEAPIGQYRAHRPAARRSPLATPAPAVHRALSLRRGHGDDGHGRSGHDALGRAPFGHPQARAADLRHHRHSAVLRRAAHLDPAATAAGHRHDPQRPAHRPLARPDPAVPAPARAPRMEHRTHARRRRPQRGRLGDVHRFAVRTGSRAMG